MRSNWVCDEKNMKWVELEKKRRKTKRRKGDGKQGREAKKRERKGGRSERVLDGNRGIAAYRKKNGKDRYNQIKSEEVATEKDRLFLSCWLRRAPERG